MLGGDAGGFKFGFVGGFEITIVGTGVPDGPPPIRRSSLSGICYLRTVEDAGPYEYDLFVGFKQTDKPQFETPIGIRNRTPTGKILLLGKVHPRQLLLGVSIAGIAEATDDLQLLGLALSDLLGQEIHDLLRPSDAMTASILPLEQLHL